MPRLPSLLLALVLVVVAHGARAGMFDNGAPNGAPITATGGTVARSAADRAADRLNVKDFGAYMDGTSHPLSTRFATLAAAQAVYPFVTSLAQESDSVAVQAAINKCGTLPNGATIHVPNGDAQFSEGVTISTSFCRLASDNARSQMVYAVNKQGALYAARFKDASGFSGPIVRVSPVESLTTGADIVGSGVSGITLDCQGVAGCIGAVVKSDVFFDFDVAVNEPKEATVTTSASSAAGSTTLTFANTATIPNLDLGAAVTHANLLPGTYVTAYTSTTVSLSAAVQTGGVASGDAVGFGGEGVRFDTAKTYTTNTISWGEIRLQVLNSTGNAPLVSIGGSAPATGNGGGYGNSALLTFRSVECYFQTAPCMVFNNSDHIYTEFLTGYYITPGSGTGALIVSNGSNLPAGTNNGPAYSNRFGYVNGNSIPILVRGTDKFTYASTNIEFAWIDYNNSTPLPTLGTGATAYTASDLGKPVGRDGSTFGIQAQIPDGTAARGTSRGNYSVDLQTVRGASGQVAAGTWSVVAGGNSNSASQQGAGVTNGLSNIGFGWYSRAGGNSAYAYGFGWDCYGASNAGSNLQSESCTAELGQVSNTASAMRLTGDHSAPTTGTNSTNNCLNIIDNSQATMDIQLSAFDRSNTNLWYSWHEPHAVLRRVSGVGSTTYTASGSASSLVGGAMSASVSASADTTNGCLNLTFNPPAGNTDYISVTATVRFTWTQ